MKIINKLMLIGILASFFCFRKKLLLEMLRNMFTAPNDEYINKMYFFINNFTKACFVWVYSATDAPNKQHNRVHYVSIYVPNLQTACLVFVNICLLLWEWCTILLTLNLHNLKFFRFLKNVSVITPTLLKNEKFFINLIQRD